MLVRSDPAPEPVSAFSTRLPGEEGAAASFPAPAVSPIAPSLAEGLPECDGRDALRDWLRSFARRLGFYGARYVHLGHGCVRTTAVRPARFLSTAARDEGQGAVGAWLSGDPSIARAATAFAPFAWSTRRRPELTEHQRAWLDAERARGVGGGIALPVQDHAAGPACVSIFGVEEADAAQLIRRRAPELAFAAALFHECMRAQVPAGSVGSKVMLTRREIECLRLAAIGNTVIQTALILGIAERTVEFHLANAAAKLGAANKVHAVAIAASDRLIAI